MAIPWRRVFAMSLRGLMVAILMIGVFLGWRVNRANTQRRAVAVILKEAGDSVDYDFAFENGRGKLIKTRWTPQWLRKAIGDEYFQEVTMIHFVPRSGKPTLSDETMTAIGRLDQLEHLPLGQFTVTDAGLAHLSGLTRLRTFEVDHCPEVTDRGLAHLRQTTDLRILHLSYTSITDTGLSALSGNRSVENLNVHATGLTDAGLAQIGRQWKNSLQELSFADCPGVTDAGLAHLRGMVRLRYLALSGTPITDAGLAHLSSLTDLQNLIISSPISDAGLVHLRSMAKLRFLFLLDNPQVTDAGLAHLSGLTDLVYLRLINTRVTDAGLVHLRGLKKLRSLIVDQSDVSNEGLAALRAELPSLTNVSNKKRPATSSASANPK